MLKDDIDNWKKQVGLSTLSLGDGGEVEYALSIKGSGITLLSITQLDEVMTILANYLIFLAHEMGVLYARVKYLENSKNRELLQSERIKYNIIRPVHDAIKVKIDLLKKIYDRKMRENVGSSGR